MKNILRKLHNRSGMSLVFSIAVLLACSVLCASLLSIAAGSAGSAAGLREQEQAYLTLRSAARLVQKLPAGDAGPALTEGRPVTVIAEGLQSVEAELKDGVLTLSIPETDYSMLVKLPDGED